jgi:nitroreductase
MDEVHPVLTAIASHRTVRRYADTPLDDELVRRVVTAARQAATSSNVQAYALLRVRDPARRERLVELTGCQPQVARAGGFFVVCADARRHRLVAAREGTELVANLETFLVGVIDASLFAQNLALGFEAHGLGICYIGGLRNRLSEVDALLDLPQDVLPLFGLCVGTPAEEPGERPRLPLEAVLLEERYPTDEDVLAQVDAYDAVMRERYAARGKPGHSWTGGIVRKYARARREDLASYYEGKGARLT